MSLVSTKSSANRSQCVQPAGDHEQAMERGDALAAAEILAQNSMALPGVFNSLRATARLGNAFIKGNVGSFLAACFTGEREVLTARGMVRFDELTQQDMVAAAPEDEPDGKIEFKRVEEIFRTVGEIWHLHVQGQLIRSTAEHPFYVLGRGWVACQDLQPGDVLRSHDGQTVAVDVVFNRVLEPL